MTSLRLKAIKSKISIKKIILDIGTVVPLSVCVCPLFLVVLGSLGTFKQTELVKFYLSPQHRRWW